MFAEKIQVPEEKTLFSSVVIKRVEKLVICINEYESLVETGLQKEQFTTCMFQVKRKCGVLLESVQRNSDFLLLNLALQILQRKDQVKIYQILMSESEMLRLQCCITVITELGLID